MARTAPLTVVVERDSRLPPVDTRLLRRHQMHGVCAEDHLLFMRAAPRSRVAEPVEQVAPLAILAGGVALRLEPRNAVVDRVRLGVVERIDDDLIVNLVIIDRVEVPEEPPVFRAAEAVAGAIGLVHLVVDVDELRVIDRVTVVGQGWLHVLHNVVRRIPFPNYLARSRQLPRAWFDLDEHVVHAVRLRKSVPVLRLHVHHVLNRGSRIDVLAETERVADRLRLADPLHHDDVSVRELLHVVVDRVVAVPLLALENLLTLP
mmetsp:Transcript_9045/g.29714  ORF Transcript_9045/g.29714 Transcript_9045/m.29714 type:complete len:261 (+) Transcript_9045:497-1279(+)